MTPPLPSLELFDTHMHLERDGDPAEGFVAARKNGVTRFLIAGGCLESSTRAAHVAAAEPGAWAAAGVHPHDAEDFDCLPPFEKLLALSEVVAVGEIGLDYHYDNSPRDAQRRVFETFIDLAGQLGLPAIVHCREAFDDCLAILKNTLRANQVFEIHSFTGTPDEARTVLEMGAYLSYNGMTTFRRADNIRETLAIVPGERLLLETDAPWLAPVPHRGKKNQPGYVRHIAEYVATFRKTPLAELAEQTTANARRFFNV
ncbi:MAG: TatD family hydrolase [Lentisphaeria bacterium]|nr:TatD family hydrolase [Lentisphaeria bacterium]